MRLFLAVFPSPAAQGAAFAGIESLRRPGDRVSWVQRQNLHYTMRFLGEVGEDGLRRASEAARQAAAAHAPFDAALGALGAFPSPRRARVLWIGMTLGEPPLLALAESLAAALERRGFAREGRAFAAHLTLGRVREPGPDWSARLESFRVDAAAARFRVDRLCVVESRLDPAGSVYTVREEAKLAG
ncbi:MAG: 2'-5' RNA ligase [Candidatus Eisenbacteria bacterium RBG_16_71_46]|nr:MAG: 2'-5' RNA ligase [Candidatus Eisenbacteria bacterium RBG_16_71_46]